MMETISQPENVFPIAMSEEDTNRLKIVIDGALAGPQLSEKKILSMPSETAVRLLEAIASNLLIDQDSSSSLLENELEPDNDYTEEDISRALTTLIEAQATASRINLRLDSIHYDLQASIVAVREAHETAAAIRQVREAA